MGHRHAPPQLVLADRQQAQAALGVEAGIRQQAEFVEHLVAQVLDLIEDQQRELAGLAEAQVLAAYRLAVRGAAARRFQPECLPRA